MHSNLIKSKPSYQNGSNTFSNFTDAHKSNILSTLNKFWHLVKQNVGEFSKIFKLLQKQLNCQF